MSLDMKVVDNLPISLLEDVKSYGELIKTISCTLKLGIPQPKPVVDDALYDTE